MEREAEAAKEELAVGGWQPFEEIINSTTTKSTTTITTVGTTGMSSSKHYINGAQFIVSEEDFVEAEDIPVGIENADSGGVGSGA